MCPGVGPRQDPGWSDLFFNVFCETSSSLDFKRNNCGIPVAERHQCLVVLCEHYWGMVRFVAISADRGM